MQQGIFIYSDSGNIAWTLKQVGDSIFLLNTGNNVYLSYSAGAQIPSIGSPYPWKLLGNITYKIQTQDGLSVLPDKDDFAILKSNITDDSDLHIFL